MTRCPPNVKCRGVVPAVSHIMLHSDTLANEFNDILNAVEIFAPFQPLDPAVTFYAPLRNNTRDLRLNQDTFSRNSEAWYLDGSGIYRRSLSDQARFENGRLLMEPAKTNKCTNYNANPDSGVINVVGAGATVRRIYNPQAIQAAGLQDICLSGFVVELENETGSLVSAYINGTTGNLNTHTCSLWMNTFGESIGLGLGGTGYTQYTTTELQRCLHTGDPDTTNRVLVIQLDPGEKCQFVLNQLEESPVVTSPIITQGASSSRAIDTLQYFQPAGFENLFNQTEGMLVVGYRPKADSASASGNRALVTLSQSVFGLLYYDENQFKTYDGVNGNGVPRGAFLANDEFSIAVRWSGAVSEIGFKKNEDSWVWSTETVYDGAWPSDNTNLFVAFTVTIPEQLGDLTIYNEDKGTAWIEANYP